jgi:hypothetical protein
VTAIAEKRVRSRGCCRLRCEKAEHLEYSLKL